MEPYSPRHAEGPQLGGPQHNRIPLVQTRPTPPKQVRVPNRKPSTVATITGQRARSTLPGRDTPRDAEGFSPRRDGLPCAPDPAQSALSAWHAATPRLAGTPHVRISHDGGRTYP